MFFQVKSRRVHNRIADYTQSIRADELKKINFMNFTLRCSLIILTFAWNYSSLKSQQFCNDIWFHEF